MPGTNALIKVAKDTIGLCSKDPDSSKVFLVNDLQGSSNNEKKTPFVTVENRDYISIAYDRAANQKVAILNMCSDQKAGGGFLKGTTAGEEELCRRSSLDRQLTLHEAEYPFRDRKLIYSKDVTIFKAEDTYKRLKPERDVDVISIPALRTPRLTPNRDAYLNKTDYDDMQARINAILQIAQANGIQCVVLSAFGSGCFGNPPDQVAHIFKECLAYYRFDAVFGILDDRLRGKTTSNYDVYRRVFCS